MTLFLSQGEAGKDPLCRLLRPLPTLAGWAGVLVSGGLPEASGSLGTTHTHSAPQARQCLPAPAWASYCLLVPRPGQQTAPRSPSLGEPTVGKDRRTPTLLLAPLPSLPSVSRSRKPQTRRAARHCPKPSSRGPARPQQPCALPQPRHPPGLRTWGRPALRHSQGVRPTLRSLLEVLALRPPGQQSPLCPRLGPMPSVLPAARPYLAAGSSCHLCSRPRGPPTAPPPDPLLAAAPLPRCPESPQRQRGLRTAWAPGAGQEN